MAYKITYGLGYAAHRKIDWIEGADLEVDSIDGQLDEGHRMDEGREDEDDVGSLPELEPRYSYYWLFIDELASWIQVGSA